MDEVWRRPAAAPARPTKRPDVTAILPHLLLGEYLLSDEISWLTATHSVTAIVNLQDSQDLQTLGLDVAALRRHAAACGVAYHHLPVPDCSPDDLVSRLDRVLGTLTELDAAGHVIYVHCNAGLNRAPTVAIAYLRAHCGISLAEACAWVKARRACGPYMPALERYFAR